MNTIHYKPSAYRGINSNTRKINESGTHTSIKKIKTFIQNQESNQLLRYRKNLNLDVNVPTTPFDVGESDLAAMSNFQYSNRRFNYFVILIDRSTRYLVGRALKDKTKQTIVDPFRSMFEEI